MTTKMRWFKFYPGDWSVDTQGMSAVAKGAYIDMLCMQWSGRRIPADPAKLARIFPQLTEDTYEELLQHFHEVDGWLVNQRLEDERSDARSRSENGKAAAKKKWSASAECDSNATPDAAALPNRMDEQCDTLCHRETETEAETETEEEEEREEDVSSAPRKARAKPTDPIVWTSESSWAGITEADRAAWAIAYPAVDIDRDLVKADQYLRSNPAKAHKRKWRSFITRWFDRTQERGGNRTDLNAVPAKGAAHGFRANRSHIPPDCRPEDEYLFWDGSFPRIPNLYTDNDGNLRHGETRNIICPAKPKLELTASANRTSVTNAGESHD
jgi:uncharacterized protein YdaU (DUF1376 family)